MTSSSKLLSNAVCPHDVKLLFGWKERWSLEDDEEALLPSVTFRDVLYKVTMIETM